MTTTTPKANDPVEVVPAVIAGNIPAQAASTPTQVRRPWRSTARTVFQAFVGLCVLAPLLVQTAGLDVEQLPWLAVVLGVAAAITRIMAIPGVETWLRRFFPFLAAAPAPGPDDRGAVDTVLVLLVAILLGVVLVLFGVRLG